MKNEGNRRPGLMVSIFGVGLGISAVLAGQAAAQTPPAEPVREESWAGDGRNNVERVVITANRRGEESLIDVPQAVSAYSGDTLQKFSVDSLEDLSKIDPSLVVQNQSATQQRVVIRGIASTTTQTAGLYLDETPLLGGYNGNLNGDGSPGLRIHDVDHVEILKGPQGTLFGSGSMSGTLRVLTRVPSLTGVEGLVEGSYAGVESGNPYYDADFAFSAPIVKDKLGFRAVGWMEQDGGYIDSIPGGGVRQEDANDRQLFGGRVSTLWQPTDNFSIQLSAIYQHAEVNGPEQSTARVGEPGFALRAPPAGGDKWVYYGYADAGLDDRFQLFNVVANYDLGFGEIIASAADGRRNVTQTLDSTPIACGFGLCPPARRPTAFTSNQEFQYNTQEIRFSSRFNGPLQFVVGAYRQQDARPYYGSALQADPNSGVTLCANYFDCRDKGLTEYVIFVNSDLFKTNQVAFYAQADYKITDQFTLTFGGRYFRAKLKDYARLGFFPDDTFNPFSDTTDKTTQDKPTYNVALLWEPSRNWSVYGRVATGFRIGGVNVAHAEAAVLGVSLPATYAPDTLTNYELGTKAYFLNDKVFLDASVYHIDWKGQQLGAQAAGAFSYQLNAGKTETNGAEVSATFLPTEGLSIGASVTYTDAKLATDLPPDVQAGGTPGLNGDQLPYVPKWGMSVRGEYERPISDDLSGYLQGSFTYRDETSTGFRPGPGSYDLNIPSYELVDLKAGVRTETFDVGLFVRNLFNEYAITNISASIDAEYVTTSPPRTIGVQVQGRF